MTLTYSVETFMDVKTPMRDGVNLSADVYLPRADGPFPTVLIRTPYDNNTDENIGKARALANLGYACVVQDTRGRYDSDGHNVPFHGQAEDGFDTQEWIGRQPWSNGKVGTAGGSYLGIIQWQGASLASQYLTCTVPRVAPCDHVVDAVAPGGAFQLSWLLDVAASAAVSGRAVHNIQHYHWTEAVRMLPLVEFDERIQCNLPFWKPWIQQPLDAAYWTALDVSDRWDEITAPAFNMSGWYDVHIQSAFTFFNGLCHHGGSPEARQSKLVVGPWLHNLSNSARVGDIDFGSSSMQDLDGMELQWFDYWLKGIDNGIVDEPPLKLFIMGINQWRDEHEWPLARTDWQTWYLHSDGRANTVRGDGSLSLESPSEEPADGFVYDPEYPVQTLGGPNLCQAIASDGPHDQRPVEMRNDVLCYTSDPLEANLEVTGPIKLVLYAATDGTDTDWTAKLVDVSPTGYAKNLCDGIIRARYRNGFGHPTLLTSGEVYEYEIEVGVTGNVFLAGHRIRLEVSSSNFPRFDRNPNTGHPIGMDTELRSAEQTVHHSQPFPSHLVLPVIPGKEH